MSATVAVYAPHVRAAAFVYEDNNDIDTTYRAWQGWRMELHDAAVMPARVLTRVTLRTVGFSAPRQHATNLALHLLAGLLLFAVAAPAVGAWPAVAAAGLWWLLPIQTEAVAYVSARGDLLLAVTLLLGLLAVEADAVGWALVAACAAVGAKETGIAAFALLPLWAWFRGRDWHPVWRAGWLVAVLLPLGVALGARDLDAMRLTLTLEPLRQAAALLVPHALTVDPGPSAAWPLVAVLGALVGLAWPAPRWAWLLAGWTLAVLLPRCLVPLREGLHEHHLYTIMIPVVVGLAAAISAVRTSQDGLRWTI